jgi:capsular polysaccharide biosynthesis protein
MLLEETAFVARMIDPDFEDKASVDLGRPDLFSPLTRISRPVLHCFHRSTPAYGHFILDGLVTVQSALGALVEGQLSLLMPAYMPPWALNAVRALGIPDANIILAAPEVVLCDSLVVASSINTSTTFRPDPELCGGLRQQFSPSRAPSRQLYLSRSNQSSYSQRSIVNESAVQDMLVAKGFEVLEPGNMTLKAQAEAFSTASVIVGAHGSAFGNLVFASVGALVIDMMPAHWVGYWGDSGIAERWLLNLTAALGLRYRLVLCASDMVRVLPDEDHSGLQKFGMACTVDLDLLDQSLQTPEAK